MPKEKVLKDGFYRVRRTDETVWTTVGELVTEGTDQYLYLPRFDEALDPKDFVIHCLPIVLNFGQ